MQVLAVIKPGSRKGPEAQLQSDGSYVLYVREPAVEGKANAAAMRLLAQALKVAPSRVTLVRGSKSRTKVFLVE